MSNNLQVWIQFGWPLFVLVATYFVGSAIEKRHFRRIIAREDAMHGFPVLTFEKLPGDCNVRGTVLVTGSIVVSLDYFKRIIAGLRAIIGGRVKTYEPLLERARREAVLRMSEDAKRRGFDGVINVRLETSRLANARGNGEGIAGVEMLAFGTAVKLR